MSTHDNNTRLTGGGDRWEGRLSDYLDDELGAAELEALEAHLGHCSSCRQALDDLRALVADAAARRRPVVPAQDLWPGIARRLQPRLAGRRSAGGRWQQQVRWIAPRLAAAAVLLVACLAAWFWLMRQAPAGTPPANTARARLHPMQHDAAYEDSVAELWRGAH